MHISSLIEWYMQTEWVIRSTGILPRGLAQRRAEILHVTYVWLYQRFVYHLADEMKPAGKMDRE